jgi:hypothetical protein
MRRETSQNKVYQILAEPSSQTTDAALHANWGSGLAADVTDPHKGDTSISCRDRNGLQLLVQLPVTESSWLFWTTVQSSADPSPTLSAAFTLADTRHGLPIAMLAAIQTA